jgi:hypothetical protein
MMDAWPAVLYFSAGGFASAEQLVTVFASYDPIY